MFEFLFACLIVFGYCVGAALLIVLFKAVTDWLIHPDVDDLPFEPHPRRCERNGIRR